MTKKVTAPEGSLRAPQASRKKTPAMERRTTIVEAMAARGHAYSNLWLAQSVRANRDWILPSDPEFVHFLCLEFDPEVRTLDLAPPEVVVRVGHDDRKTRFDAIVEFVDGRRECREVKFTESVDPADVRSALQHEAQLRACERFNGTYVRVYGDVLAKQRYRWLNSARMLRCIHASEGYATQRHRSDCGTRLIHSPNGVRLQELVTLFPPDESALVMAAVFRLLSERLLSIDIDTEWVTLASLVRLRT